MKRFYWFFCVLLLGFRASALTQSEMEAAVLAALEAWSFNSTGWEGAIATMPLSDDQNFQFLADYLTGSGTANDLANSVGFVLKDISTRWWPYIYRIGSASNQLERIRSDLADVKTNVSAIESYALAAASDLGHLLSSFVHYYDDYLFYVSRSDSLLSDLRSLQLSISNKLSSVDSSIGDFASDVTIQLGDILQDMTLNASYLEQLSYDLAETHDVLTSIEGASWETAGGVGGILTYLEANLMNLFASLDAGVFNLQVAVTNALDDLAAEFPDFGDGLGITNWPSTLTDQEWFDDLLAKSRDQYSTQRDILGAVSNLFSSATNFYSSMIPSSSQIDDVRDQTNFVSNVVVSNDVSASDDVDALSNEAARVTSSWFDDLDFFTTNPYDGGDSSFENFEDSVDDLLGSVDPATTSDVILMGSVDVAPSRSASGWASLVSKLPRIEFNMENLFTKWKRLATVKNMFKALWLIVGVFYRMILLWTFLEWFARYDKR